MKPDQCGNEGVSKGLGVSGGGDGACLPSGDVIIPLCARWVDVHGAAKEIQPGCGLFFPFPELMAQYVEDLGV